MLMFPVNDSVARGRPSHGCPGTPQLGSGAAVWPGARDLSDASCLLGTVANAIALSALTPAFRTIFCSNTAHLETRECGATELFSGGAKLTKIQARPAADRRRS